MSDVDLAGGGRPAARAGRPAHRPAAALAAALAVVAATAVVSATGTPALATATVRPSAPQPEPGAAAVASGLATDSSRCAASGGPILDLNPGLAGVVGSDIPLAFNPSDDEFLVAWNQNLGSSADVLARRVAADGSLPAPPQQVAAGDDVFTDPAVAHDPSRNRYFVSWRFQGGAPGSPDFNNGFGRLLTAAGEPAGEVVHVSPAGFEPTVVFNPVTGEFFHHARNFAGGGTPGILFRRIGGDGVPLGSPTQIAPIGGPGEVGVNPTTGEYLSTWRGTSDADPTLRGRLLDGTGTPLDDSFVIADFFPAVRAASVAYDPGADRYLVVFSTFFEPSPVLHAQFVTGQGELVGPLLTLVDSNGDRPRIAFDPVNEVYLVTWFAAGSGLWAQLLSPEGTALGDPRNVAAGTPVFSPTGRVAANANDGGFLVSWRREDDRVAARLVEVVSGCAVSLDPPGLDFGEQEVGTTSPPQTVTVGNTGSDAVTVSSLAVSGEHADDFRVAADTCTGQPLDPGASCTFDVRFAPSDVEPRAGLVEVHSDAPTSPDPVAVTGVGTAPVVVLLPSSLEFGEVERGQTAPAQDFEVFNNGTAPLRLETLAVQGAHAGDFDLVDDTCSGRTLGPRELCSVGVTFRPSATGAREAEVAVPSNALTSPDAVALAGTGVGEPPAIDLDPTELAASLAAGERETLRLTVTNLGDETLVWEVSEEAAPAGPPGSWQPAAGTTQDCLLPEWLQVDPGSGQLTGGASQPVEVTLDTTGLAAGDHPASLCFASNDPVRPLVVVPVTLTVVDDGGDGCDETITGVHPGPLTVAEGVTCLAAGAHVLGEVNVRPGAGLVATAAVVLGPVSALGAARLELVFSQVTGPVSASATTGTLGLFGNQVTGSVSLLNSSTGDTPAVVAGNTVIGSLSCFGNQPEPTHLGLPNVATGGKLGQCAAL